MFVRLRDITLILLIKRGKYGNITIKIQGELSAFVEIGPYGGVCSVRVFSFPFPFIVALGFEDRQLAQYYFLFCSALSTDLASMGLLYVRVLGGCLSCHAMSFRALAVRTLVVVVVVVVCSPG